MCNSTRGHGVVAAAGDMGESDGRAAESAAAARRQLALSSATQPSMPMGVDDDTYQRLRPKLGRVEACRRIACARRRWRSGQATEELVRSSTGWLLPKR